MCWHARTNLAGLGSLILLLLVSPPAAQAQKLVVELPASFDASLLSGSGQQVVALTAQRLVADDADDQADAYRFDVARGVWTRAARARLVGVPDTGSASTTILMLAVSDDGRYLGYLVQRWTPTALDAVEVLVRYDFDTGERIVVRNDAVHPFRAPVMSRDGATFAWLDQQNAVVVGTVGQAPRAIGQACAPSRSPCDSAVALTALGERALYTVLADQLTGAAGHLEVVDLATATRRTYPQVPAGAQLLRATGSGRHVLLDIAFEGPCVFDVLTGTLDRLPAGLARATHTLSDDGAYLLADGGQLYDRGSSLLLMVAPGSSRGLSADGRFLAVEDSPGFSGYRIFAVDGDGDGMLDAWETVHGLDPLSPLDATTDPDADGIASRDEFDRRSHPRGLFRRYFAEGVESDFFTTRVYVLNAESASGEDRRPVTVRFEGDDGVAATRTLQRQHFVVGDGGAGMSPAQERGEAQPPSTLTSRQFSILVESEEPFAAERLTTWGAPALIDGAHASSGVAAPAQDWFFAEGATTGRFHTFYLLANPGELDADVRVEYLRARGGAVIRDYTVPARGRRTVWVNQEGSGLEAAEFGAHLRASRPIVAERSMYMTGGAAFTAGTVSVGAPAPAAAWTFAAGETRAPFDMFVLLANPSTATARVQVTYLLAGGDQVQRSYDVPPLSRVTVWVDMEDPRLAATGLSVYLTSTEPLVAERAMWWRGRDGSEWTEGHTELGATQAAMRWALAHVPESATIVIDNLGAVAGRAHVDLFAKNGFRVADADVVLPPGRTAISPVTLWPALGPDRYSATVESVAAGSVAPVPVVVERTSYAPDVKAGTVFLATPVP